jgi:omega-6 fatty acid desaturase (delta-12 desaturase)
MGLMIAALNHGLWMALALVVPAAALLVRLFMIQHDCGHGSFFRSRRANDWLGRGLGVLTLTPYAWWRWSHAMHHATSGNLSRRGVGDIETLTTREYLALPGWRRLAYRLYRHPLVLFGVGPAYLFLIRHRLPIGGHPARRRESWSSVLGTNATLATVFAAMAFTVGPRSFLLAYLPVALLAASAGVWLFYVQHQFEAAYWEAEPRWDVRAAALEGSSFYDLPRALHWVTNNIGFHHIHHLMSRIPSYRLRDCFLQNPELQRGAKRLTLRGSLTCAQLALWDEDKRMLVPFRELDLSSEASARFGPDGS